MVKNEPSFVYVYCGFMRGACVLMLLLSVNVAPLENANDYAQRWCEVAPARFHVNMIVISERSEYMQLVNIMNRTLR